MNEETSSKINIEDAIKLKNQINHNIKWGGYNARQVREIKDLTNEQYVEVNRQLSEIKKSWWFFPDYVWVIGALVSCICILFYSNFSVHIIGIVVLIYCIAQLAYRSGVSYGYVRGYETGHEEGVYKALRISTEEAVEIDEYANEMEIAEIIQKRSERRETD